MYKYIMYLILLTLFSLLSLPVTDFDEANLFYEKGDYQNAIRSYEKIISAGFENGELYYDLGNSYYKTGDIVNTIVNYERALKFLPKDQDLLENLKIVRLSLVDKIEESTEVPFFTLYSNLKDNFNIYSAKRTFYFSLLILTIILSLYIILKNSVLSKVVFILNILAILFFMLTSYIYYDIHKFNSRKYGVVSENKISVLSSPDENVNSKELFFLHKGTKTEIIRSNEQWYEISLDESKKGWVKKESLIVI